MIGNLFNKLTGRQRLGSGVVYGLTNLGKTKVERGEAQGIILEILSVLEEQGPSTVSEIGEATHIARPKIGHIIPKLVRAGYIRPQTGEKDEF